MALRFTTVIWIVGTALGGLVVPRRFDLPVSKRHFSASCILMTTDMPLDVPAVRWFPAIDINGADQEPIGADNASVMPLFPLGASYLPYTSPVLNIFEPRYRAMYNDILFNGARRFCVTNVDPETGRLAEVGVVFYLDELKEVSEQTQDRVKYVGQHSVIGRVRLLRVLNPSVAATRETYLKVEVANVEDVAETDNEEGQRQLSDLFVELVDIQKQLAEEPRFTDAVKSSISFTPGSSSDEKGMWGTIQLWQQFLEQRTAVVGQRMQREIQQEVATYLKDNSVREELVNARGEIRLEDLPEPLLQEIRNIQTRYREELDALDTDPVGSYFQAMLQSESHSERMQVFRAALEKERRRLKARATLQSLFKK